MLARAKGKRVPRRASRVPWPALRAMADVKASSRGASRTESTAPAGGVDHGADDAAFIERLAAKGITPEKNARGWIAIP